LGCASTPLDSRRFCRTSAARASNFPESGRSFTLLVIRTTLARSGLPSQSHHGASSFIDRASALLAFVGPLRICFAAAFRANRDRVLLDHVSVVAESDRQDDCTNLPCSSFVLAIPNLAFGREPTVFVVDVFLRHQPVPSR